MKLLDVIFLKSHTIKFLQTNIIKSIKFNKNIKNINTN
jgi:hypothetical protein